MFVVILGRFETVLSEVRDSLSCFADSYRAAREMFLAECDARGMRRESHRHPCQGPGGEVLALDAAFSQAKGPRLLIVSSGLHGAEGQLGSALQIDSLRRGLLDVAAEWGWSVLLLHALNPFGFAHTRRWDENNVDANRNFLLPGESYEGAHEVYHRLSPLLNPTGRPPWHDRVTFYCHAAAAVLRYGFTNVKQAVAEGQYDVEQGLFFGGREPCWTHVTLERMMPQWLAGRDQVIHFDVHSGLGRWAGCQLLLDYPVRPWQRRWLGDRYEDSQWEDVDPAGDAYNARGALGKWCDQRHAEQNYLYMCAEFGTYGPLRMIRGLRRENRAWRAGQRSPRIVDRTKRLFCPQSPSWRVAASDTFWDLVNKAVAEAQIA